MLVTSRGTGAITEILEKGEGGVDQHFFTRYEEAIKNALRGRTALRTKLVNTLCIKDLFTLKIEKNIPNKMAQTRVL